MIRHVIARSLVVSASVSCVLFVSDDDDELDESQDQPSNSDDDDELDELGGNDDDDELDELVGNVEDGAGVPEPNAREEAKYSGSGVEEDEKQASKEESKSECSDVVLYAVFGAKTPPKETMATIDRIPMLKSKWKEYLTRYPNVSNLAKDIFGSTKRIPLVALMRRLDMISILPKNSIRSLGHCLLKIRSTELTIISRRRQCRIFFHFGLRTRSRRECGIEIILSVSTSLCTRSLPLINVQRFMTRLAQFEMLESMTFGLLEAELAHHHIHRKDSGTTAQQAQTLQSRKTHMIQIIQRCFGQGPFTMVKRSL